MYIIQTRFYLYFVFSNSGYIIRQLLAMRIIFHPHHLSEYSECYDSNIKSVPRPSVLLALLIVDSAEVAPR